MSRLASVIIPCWGDRHDVLARTIWCLHNQTVRVQVVLVDDGMGLSQPEAELFLRHWSDDTIINLRPPEAPHRRPNTALIAGYGAALADYIILGEPEVLVPTDAVERMLAGHVRPRRDVPVLYCLDQRMTHNIDQVDWRRDMDALTTLPGFWNYTGIFNRTNEEAKGWLHHWGFCGAYRDEWTLTDFLPPGETVELDPDNWLRAREQEQGRQQTTASFAVFHQWHERVNPCTREIDSMSAQRRRIRDAEARRPW